MAPRTTPEIFAWTESWSRARGLKTFASDEVDSTNTLAKNDENPDTRPTLASGAAVSAPTLYLARRQTSGRGRGTHAWTTPQGSDLGSSLLSSWSFAVASVPQPIFSALVGLALYESCRAVWPHIPLNIKAPNDLFISDKKTAGILIETVDQGRAKRTVIGIGINVTAKPEGLDTATCLSEHLAKHSAAAMIETDWRKFLDTWLGAATQACEAGLRGRLDDGAAQRLCEALNLHPLLKEPILRVDELGQLHSASRIIHWHEL